MRQFPRQLCWLYQWKCFVWSTKLWMFVKEMWHVVVTWSACLSHILLGRYVIKDDGGNYVTFHELICIKTKKNNKSSQREPRPSVFQCDRFIQVCLLLARPSFWSRDDTKLKISLILWNMHSTWPKCATFLWKTFIVSCSKRNIFIGPVDTVVWGTVLFEKWTCAKKKFSSRLNANGSKKPLQFVESFLKLFYMTDSRFSALYLDENIKKRNKFQFFGLRISNSRLFSTYIHCLLRLSSSDEIDIFDINWWKAIEIEL